MNDEQVIASLSHRMEAVWGEHGIPNDPKAVVRWVLAALRVGGEG